MSELPEFSLPSARSIFSHIWERTSDYLKKITNVILVASIAIWALEYFPKERPDNEPYAENSALAITGKALHPLLSPLGFDWKMGIGLVSGVGAKELIVSTLGVLYANQEVNDSAESEAQIAAALKTVTTAPAALAYMVFVLIYFPCLATLIAIKKETKRWGWAIFTAVYTTALAWVMAFAVFQIGSLL